ncbi:MAG: ribonuclease H family protein [Chitinophagales bacterium]|nr:ribonuclease H family protein [Chitinophagales bacterium]MDW8392616.1 ribonuclease H family protein [Chitinophagales bacterium]
MKQTGKYYVVFTGRSTGIKRSWEACRKATSGFSGARYRSYRTKQEAEQALAEYRRQHLHHDTTKGPLVPSICVDAACNAVTGDMEYRGVLTETGKELFRKGPFLQATNNIGEFLAIVHALAYCKKNHLNWPVYSDSQTALSWVSKKQARTKQQPTEANQEVFHLLQRAESWLRQNSFSNPLLRWDTRRWGENPADFGRK